MDPQPPAEAIRVLDYAPPASRRAVWRFLKGFGMYCFAVLLGASGAGTLGWLILPRQYITSAAIHLQSSTPGAGSAPRANFLATEAALLESPQLLKAASETASRIGVQLSPFEWDNSTIRAEVERRSDLIRLHVTSRDPNAATVVANMVLDEYAKTVLGQSGVDLEIFQPPLTAVRTFNRPVISIFATTGVLVALALLHRTRRRISR